MRNPNPMMRDLDFFASAGIRITAVRTPVAVIFLSCKHMSNIVSLKIEEKGTTAQNQYKNNETGIRSLGGDVPCLLPAIITCKWAIST